MNLRVALEHKEKMSLRDKDIIYAAKQEEGGDSTNPSSSRQLSGLKNPRIVPVSRTFGGKDRHSKVCTIKGLRDRRIRLSVPTAIQLYDLQDRLGLNQPSKVIDWLLDSTKHDIDKLPPLPIVPGSFNSFHHPMSTSQGYQDPQSSSNSFLDTNFLTFRKEVGVNINNQGVDDANEDDDQSFVSKLKYWGSDIEIRSKQKGVDQGTMEDGHNNSQVCAQNLFPIASGNSSILPHSTLLNNNMFNYYQWEPSNLSLTQLGNHGLSNTPNDHNQQSNSSRLPPSVSQQLSLYPSMTTSPYLHTHASFMNTHNHQLDHNELRQFNRFQYSNNPISSPIHNPTTLGSKSFPWSINHHHHLPQNDDIPHNLDKDDHDT